MEQTVRARFGPAYRLRKTDDYSSVFAFRRSVKVGSFQLFFRPNGLATARLGVVVGKKFVPLAVGRNRIKRIAREAFRLSRCALPGMDLVLRVCAKPPLGGNVRGEIEALLHRVAKGGRL